MCAMFFTLSMSAQVIVSLTPDTAGTIIGVDHATTAGGNVHKFTSPQITGGYQAWAIDVYVTASGTHATDSTHVAVYGSYDGTNYFQITDLGTPWLIGSGVYYGSTYSGNTYMGVRLSSTGATAGWGWKVASPMPYRYIQVKISQYKKLSILTVNRCKLHLFK